MDGLSGGQLQSLKYRLSDAQRELPRAEPEQQERIREDIKELERLIVQQQRLIDNPKAIEERVQQSIEAGLESERKPAKPVSGITKSKFINQPPLIAPTWFQDRHFETHQIGEFLKDESLRLMTIVGRGGVGKSAMVCRLLRSLEGGQLPDDGELLTIDGIVYLSAARSFHRTNLPDMFAGLMKLLPDESVKQLETIYKNPQSTTRATMEAIVQAFPTGRTIVLLDHFEDMLAVETGNIKDLELDEMLRALLELPPHGLKIIITTRVAMGHLALVQPGLQRRLDLDTGLEHPFAENILVAMDTDGKIDLRDASETLLSKARERTLGYPRALEHLFGILSADRDTSLQKILDDTSKFLPEQVMTVLVGEAYSRLDLKAQKVMQALAIYRYPVPPSAVDYLLQPHVPGIDSSRVLRRLVNMRFVHRDAGRYYLHQVDRDYALGRIQKGTPNDREVEDPPMTCYSMRHRAAEWFCLSRKPRDEWKTLGDLAAQLSEIELSCEGGDHDAAATVLLEIDFDYLYLLGNYRLMTELHLPLQGKIIDSQLVEDSARNLSLAYRQIGQFQKAINYSQKGLQLAREKGNRYADGLFLSDLATCEYYLGQNKLAIEYLEKSLSIYHDFLDQVAEAVILNNLALFYLEIGQITFALENYKQALLIHKKMESQNNEYSKIAREKPGLNQTLSE